VYLQGVAPTSGRTLKAVGPEAVLALLFNERFIYIGLCLNPFLVKGSRIIRFFPVGVRQAYRIAKRIDFPFALMDSGPHVRMVGKPFSLVFRIVIKRVGIGIDIDALALFVYESGNKTLQFGVVGHEG